MLATKLRLPAWLSISSSGANRGPAKAAWKDLGKNWRGGSWMAGHGTRSRFGGLTSRSPQKPSTQRHLFHQETRRSRIVSNRKFSRGDPWCERSGFVAIFPHKVYGMLRKFGFRRPDPSSFSGARKA